jgi:hypothetical protein
MRNLKKLLSLSLLLTVAFLLNSCNPIEDDTKSSSLLIIESILGQDAEGAEANYLQSDVLKEDSVFADVAVANVRAATLDPVPLLGASQYNDIMLTRYTVSYSRTDGKNTPGVDVPYPFEGSLSALIKVGSATSFGFVVVREVAKLELPLIRLADGGAEGVLTCTAKIDLYGHDLTNNNVKATGYLTVHFANYVD